MNNCDFILLLLIAVYGQIDGGLILFSCGNPNIAHLIEAVFQRGLPAFTAVRGRVVVELFNLDWRIFYRRLGLFSLPTNCRGCIEALLAVVKKF